MSRGVCVCVCVLGAGGGCAHACSLRIYAACYLLRFLNPCLVSVIYFDTCRPVYLPVFLLLCYLRLLFLFGTRITMSNLFQFHVAGCSFTFFFFSFSVSCSYLRLSGKSFGPETRLQAHRFFCKPCCVYWWAPHLLLCFNFPGSPFIPFLEFPSLCLHYPSAFARCLLAIGVPNIWITVIVNPRLTFPAWVSFQRLVVMPLCDLHYLDFWYVL